MLSQAIEEVEIHLRARAAYYHAHRYGATGYLDAANYSGRHSHAWLIDRIDSEIKRNKKTLFVKHHIDAYGGRFPIWVITELFTFGMLSRFYSIWTIADQKNLAKDTFDTIPKKLTSWLRCCTDLRNICAHYGRLYFRIFTAVPASMPWLEADARRRLFGAVMALKALYPDAGKWNAETCPRLEKLIGSYSHAIKLDHIGFPHDWKAALKK